MKTPSVSLASLVRQLSALRCPKNAAGVRSSLHFSTAAEIPDSLHLPPAARVRNSPEGEPRGGMASRRGSQDAALLPMRGRQDAALLPPLGEVPSAHTGE